MENPHELKGCVLAPLHGSESARVLYAPHGRQSEAVATPRIPHGTVWPSNISN